MCPEMLQALGLATSQKRYWFTSPTENSADPVPHHINSGIESEPPMTRQWVLAILLNFTQRLIY